MKIQLDDYREPLEKVAPELADTLDATFHEAAHIMAPADLHEYLAGARGLAESGRGAAVVVSYLHNMPLVARETGSDIIGECITSAMKLSSMTSGEVIALLFNSLPTAARRLGDPELVRAYLALVHRLSARAPRGLRPMLGVIDELLSKLTLSGLRRWVDFGADAYRRDLQGQAAYFGLQTDDSRAILQQERRGTLFIDSQRKLNFYLRALWARDFFLRPTAADHAGFRPFIETRTLHLPDALDSLGGVTGIELYRATAAHMAAHMSYTSEPFSPAELGPAQMFFIGFAEDARIEWCAAQDFPGLGTLWQRLQTLERDTAVEHPTMLLLERTALGLLNRDHRTGDAEVDALVDYFHDHIAENRDKIQFSWNLGMDLFNLLAARKDVPSLRILEALRIPYRDDNRFIWVSDELAWADGVEYIPASERQVRREVSVMMMAHELDCETAGDDAQEVWTCKTEIFPYREDAGSLNNMFGKEPVSDPFHYHEWDYQVQLHRPDWTTVYERRQGRGDPEDIQKILTANRGVTHRIRQIIDRLRPQGVIRQRKLEDGDQIDINAAIDSMIDIREGRQPDPRITLRNVIHTRDLAIVILLDLSESTNEVLGDSEKTVLELTREACALVGSAISGIGDTFAVHGFASDGRHDVQYYRFKDFEQPWDDDVKARLAGMKGGLSTRMGSAMRHAGQHLLKRPEKRKLLLIVTDGEPADVDERDPQHLRMDTKKAAEELYTRGVLSYCLTLDPNADEYVQRIFGANHYTIIDHVDRLPEKLPALFASLTS